jgi:hypothetical protein
MKTSADQQSLKDYGDMYDDHVQMHLDSATSIRNHW